MSNLYNLKKGVASLADLVDGELAKLFPTDKLSNVYYVDVNRGSDSWDGLSKSKPFATIAKAVAVMNARIDWSDSPWARHDIMVIAPGTYAENLTSLPYGGVMIGLGHDMRDAQQGVNIKPASGDPVDVSSCINAAFYNIGFEASGAIPAFDADICNNVLFYGCRFAGAAATNTTTGFVTKDAVYLKFIDCEFVNLDKGFDANYADAGDSLTELLIKDCIFRRIDTAGIEISTNLVGGGALVQGCTIMGGGSTLAIGIDDNSGILDLVDCYITATDPVDACRSANGCYGNGSLLSGAGA